MRHWHACVLSATLIWCTSGRCAPGGVGVLAVRAGHAAPACFTISQADELRHGAPGFDAISVTDAANPKLIMWAMALPTGRTFALSYRMCVPYAGRLPVLPQTPAAPLIPGRVYEAAVAVRTPTAGAPRRYRSRFCVRGGQVAVVSGTQCPL